MKQAVGVIIHDADNRVFLQHRDAQAPTNPEKWGLWGGSVEDGETLVVGAVRELEEELSITVAGSNLTYFGRYASEDGLRELHVYILADIGQFTYQQREGDDMRYFSHAELVGLVLTPRTKAALQDYFGTEL